MVDIKKLAGAVRAKRGRLSLRKASESAGVSYATLSNIENGIYSSPDLETMLKLADWLGVPIEYFRTEREAQAA